MKDSDLGIPPRPPVVPTGANGPAPQTEEKRGPGRPAGTGTGPKLSNVKPVSTERLIATKEELESLLVGAGDDRELIDKVADLQLMVSDLERILITRRKVAKL
jgi:hypothetical protein